MLSIKMRLSALLIGLLWLLLLNPQSIQAQQQTLFDQVAADARLTNFEEGLTATGLDRLLRQHGPFTVFAPTDAVLTEEVVAALSPQQLRHLLLYHIVPGEIGEQALRQRQTLRTALGVDLALRVDDQQLRLADDVQLVAAPVALSNGVLYVVDGILTPPGLQLPETDEGGSADEDALSPTAVGLSPLPAEVELAVNPASVPFSFARLRRDAAVLQLALDQMGGWLDRLKSGSSTSCGEYIFYYFYIANLPFHAEVPPSAVEYVLQYEDIINDVLDTNEPMTLYCMNPFVFSDFNFALARLGIANGNARIGQLQKTIEPLIR